MGEGARQSAVDRLVEKYVLLTEASEDEGLLERLCAAHPDLADEVRRRVRDVEGLRRTFRVAAPEESPLIGPARLGRFEIRGELGRGGMGVVYRAFDPEVEREVAIKVMNGGALVDPRQTRRFLREIRAVAHLSHPGILPVYEAGEHEGLHFYTMELVDGISLRHLVQDLVERNVDAQHLSADSWGHFLGLLSDSSTVTRDRSDESSGSRRSTFARQVARIGLRVAEALEHAHSRGVLHRDVKPANVMLARDGRILLLDFGLAEAEHEATLTSTGDLVGTPHYIPPERLSGTASDRPTEDVYSFGVTLYELLTLRKPFAGQAREQIFRQILSEEPIAPRRLNSAVPADLETIVLKAMRKESRHRYGSANELAADLERFLAGRPIRARRSGRVERFTMWARREPILASLAAALLLATVVILIGNVWYSGRLQETARALAERERVAAQNLYQADMSLAASAADETDWRQVENLLLGQVPDEGSEDLRGFEWHHLWLRGHDGVELVDLALPAASCMAIHPDGRTAAVGGGSGEVLFWDLDAKDELQRFRPHSMAALSLDFSPDGQLLASGGDDRMLVVQTAETGEVVARLGPFVDRVRCLAFSPSGAHLAMAAGNYNNDDGELRVWETTGWSEVGPALQRRSPRDLVFLSDDRLGVHYREAGPFVVDVPSLVIRREERGHEMSGSHLVGGPGRPTISTGFRRAGEGTSEILRWDDGVAVRRTMRQIRELALGPCGRWLAVVAESSAVFKGSRTGIGILDAWSLEPLAWLEGLSQPLAVGFTPDGARLVAVSADGRLGAWRTDDLPSPVEFRLGSAKQVDFSADGMRLAGSSNDCSVVVWDTTTGRTLLRTTASGRGNATVGLSADGRRVLAATVDVAQAWDVDEGTVAWTVPLERARYDAVHSAANDLLAVSWADERGRSSGVLLIDAGTGEVRVDYEHTGPPIGALGFARTSSLLGLGGCRDGDVVLWDCQDGTRPTTIGHASGIIGHLAFSADERWLATSSSYVVEIWDVETGARVAELPFHPRATSVDFVDDGRRLVACGAGGRVGFWNTSTWREVAGFQAHQEYTEALAVSSDGTMIATGAFDGRVLIWSRRSRRTGIDALFPH